MQPLIFFFLLFPFPPLAVLPCCWARPWLLFANKRDIRLFEVSLAQRASSHSPKTTVVVKQLEDAAALDFFLTETPNRVCWSENRPHTAVIKCSDIDPKKKGNVEKVLYTTMTIILQSTVLYLATRKSSIRLKVAKCTLFSRRRLSRLV